MNLFTIIDKLIGCWEKVLCGIMVLVCVLFCAIGAMFFNDLPETQSAIGKRPTADRLLPWDALTDSFFSIRIPAPAEANPFAQNLVNHLEPTPVAAPEPPKQEEPKQEPAAVEQPKQEEPPKEEPPKEDPPKPDIVITITYRGFYVDITGAPVAFITAASSENNASQNMTCKIGTKILDRITLEGISEDSASFKADEGDAVKIPWNASEKFSFKQ